jgi:hypothetical protein
MNKNKLTKKIVMTLLLGVLLLAPIAAFGISTPYMEEINGLRTFEVYQSNAENFEVVLQSGSDSPINVKVTVLEGTDVIELLEVSDIFLVNPGDKVPVNFRILSPSGAEIGDSFSVKLGFASSEEGSGALSFGTAIEKNFDVLLVEMPIYEAAPEEKETGNVALIIFVAIILLLVLIIIVLKVRKNQKVSGVKKPVKKKVVEKKNVGKKSTKKKSVSKKKK